MHARTHTSDQGTVMADPGPDSGARAAAGGPPGTEVQGPSLRAEWPSESCLVLSEPRLRSLGSESRASDVRAETLPQPRLGAVVGIELVLVLAADRGEQLVGRDVLAQLGRVAERHDLREGAAMGERRDRA